MGRFALRANSLLIYGGGELNFFPFFIFIILSKIRSSINVVPREKVFLGTFSANFDLIVPHSDQGFSALVQELGGQIFLVRRRAKNKLDRLCTTHENINLGSCANGLSVFL